MESLFDIIAGVEPLEAAHSGAQVPCSQREAHHSQTHAQIQSDYLGLRLHRTLTNPTALPAQDQKTRSPPPCIVQMCLIRRDFEIDRIPSDSDTGDGCSRSRAAC